MSLKETFPEEIPPKTREIVEGMLPDDSICRLLGEKGGDILDQVPLAAMYSYTGRGGINPVLLCFVLILQYMEKLPDRSAAEMARMRMDWKYALRQELDWQGFDYSSLCNFRKRLHAHGKEYLIFEQVLTYLRESGYIKSKRQRTDATHVLAAVERLSRLELVWETLRLALGALINADAKWVIAQLPPAFVSFYSQKHADYRLSKAQAEQAMRDAGQDGFWLLSKIERQDEAAWQALAEIELLRQVLEQQFERGDDEDGGTSVEAKADSEVSSDVVTSPHEPSVRFSRKGKDTAWRGYKLQVTETVDGVPFITDIGIHGALEADSLALGEIQQRLAQRDLLPQNQYVDQAYCNGRTLEQSAKKGTNLRGFIGIYSRKPVGFRLQDFYVNLEKRVALCPAGKTATVFNPSSQPDVAWHVRFGKQCQDCRFKRLCTSEKRGRSLEISPYHEHLTKRRREQKDRSFVREMNARARIESTICELVRKHGMRQSRYRGQHKLQLQATIAATAVNLKRLARHLLEDKIQFPLQLWKTMPLEPVFQRRPVSRPSFSVTSVSSVAKSPRQPQPIYPNHAKAQFVGATL